MFSAKHVTALYQPWGFYAWKKHNLKIEACGLIRNLLFKKQNYLKLTTSHILNLVSKRKFSHNYFVYFPMLWMKNAALCIVIFKFQNTAKFQQVKKHQFVYPITLG